MRPQACPGQCVIIRGRPRKPAAAAGSSMLGFASCRRWSALSAVWQADGPLTAPGARPAQLVCHALSNARGVVGPLWLGWAITGRLRGHRVLSQTPIACMLHMSLRARGNCPWVSRCSGCARSATEDTDRMMLMDDRMAAMPGDVPCRRRWADNGCFSGGLAPSGMRRSCESLQAARPATAEIGAQVGYRPEPAFARVFHKRYGCTARDYDPSGREGR